jgi:hypothetical protein
MVQQLFGSTVIWSQNKSLLPSTLIWFSSYFSQVDGTKDLFLALCTANCPFARVPLCFVSC